MRPSPRSPPHPLRSKECAINSTSHVFRLPDNYRVKEAASLPIGILIVLIVGTVMAHFFPDLVPRPWLIGIGAVIIAGDVLNTLFAGYRMRWTKITITSAGVIVDRGKLWHRRQFIPAQAISSVTTKVGPVDRLFHHLSITVVSAAREVGLPPLGEADGQVAVALIEELANDH